MSVLIASESARVSSASRSNIESGIREAGLIERLRTLAERTGEELGDTLSLPDTGWDAPWRAAEVVSTMTHACIARLHDLPSTDVDGARALCELVLSLQQLAMDWYLHETSRRGQRLADCAAGLHRLRGLPSSTALMDSACEELVLRCGFHRAVLSKVERSGWKPLILAGPSDNGRDRWFGDWINRLVPMMDSGPEAELLSRRRPSLVYDTASAPVYSPLIVQAGRSSSYVVAPVMLGRDVVGFLHSDHHPSERRVDESDQDVMWAFSDGFSHIYERNVLLERLRSHRNSIREVFFGAVDRLDELCEAQTRGAPTIDVEDAAPSVRVELTGREAEVFKLMVTGATNQAIADKLVITEGTVKSHVKHILRKYGAVNRAQAIAWALA